MENNGKTFSIVGLVLGIVASVLAWGGIYLSIVALVCGIVGLIFAIKGRKLAKASEGPTGLATAALVLSIVGTSLSVIGFISCGLCIILAKNVSGAVEDAINDGTMSSILDDFSSELSSEISSGLSSF